MIRKKNGQGKGVATTFLHSLTSSNWKLQQEEGGERRRTRTITLLFCAAFQHCFTGVKKNPSATATPSPRMWRGYRCFQYLCIPWKSFFIVSLGKTSSSKSRNAVRAFLLPPLLPPQKFASPHTTGGVKHFSFFLKYRKLIRQHLKNHRSPQKGDRSSLQQRLFRLDVSKSQTDPVCNSLQNRGYYSHKRPEQSQEMGGWRALPLQPEPSNHHLLSNYDQAHALQNIFLNKNNALI